MLRVKTNLRFRFGSDRVSVNHGQPAPIDLELALGSKKMTRYENSKKFFAGGRNLGCWLHVVTVRNASSG